MSWVVLFHPDFEPEFLDLSENVQDELLTLLRLLAVFGPRLGRPSVDTLKASAHANMKELRFKADQGVWRFVFAFDPKRRAVILCGGNKAGVSERRFYKTLIARADQRLADYLQQERQPG